MKTTVLFIFLLTALTANARNKDTTEYKYCVQGAYAYAIPMGNFATIHTDNLLNGNCGPAHTVSFLFSMKLSDHVTVGAIIDGADYPVDRRISYASMYQRFTKPGYYTTLNGYNNYQLSYGSLALAFSYIFKTPFAELEPYVSFGLARLSTGGLQGAYNVHHKKMNDNYFEDTYVDVINSNFFFYPGAGVRLNKQIFKVLYATAGIQYSRGTARYEVEERTVDFMYNESKTTRYFGQNVSVMQLYIGLQCRFREMHKQKHHRSP